MLTSAKVRILEVIVVVHACASTVRAYPPESAQTNLGSGIRDMGSGTDLLGSGIGDRSAGIWDQP